jgi:hypothetical protein
VRRKTSAFLAAILAGALTERAAGEERADASPRIGFEESFRAALRGQEAPASHCPNRRQSSGSTPKSRSGRVGVGATSAIEGSAYSACSGILGFVAFRERGLVRQNTHVGGADKASHFVSYYGVARIATEYNLAFTLGPGGQSPPDVSSRIDDRDRRRDEQLRLLWEDLAADTLGALRIAIIHTASTTYRPRRWVLAPDPRSVLGRDYSSEIYTET